ncbi:MAG TPA: hypothetical protein VH306_11370 [Gaiellaceae bacterium]
MTSYPVIEHRAGRASGWLRPRRFRLALGAGLLQSILVVANVVQARWIVALAVIAAIGWYFLRNSRSPFLREAGWTFVFAEAVALLVPLVALLVAGIVVIAVAALAVLVLVFLFLDRR